MTQYFHKPFRSFGGNINVKVDLPSYATRTDFNNVTHVDTSSFPLKTKLTKSKTEVDKLDIGKLEPVPVDLSNLSDLIITPTELEKNIPNFTGFVQKVKLT